MPKFPGSAVSPRQALQQFFDEQIILKMPVSSLPAFCQFISHECSLRIATQYILNHMKFPDGVFYAESCKNESIVFILSVISDTTKTLTKNRILEIESVEELLGCQYECDSFLSLL